MEPPSPSREPMVSFVRSPTTAATMRTWQPGQLAAGRSRRGMEYLISVPPQPTLRPLIVYLHGSTVKPIGGPCEILRSEEESGTPLTMNECSLRDHAAIVAPLCPACGREEDDGWWGFSHEEAVQQVLGHQQHPTAHHAD